MENKKSKVKILKDGPYAVSGGLPLVKEVIISDENGDSVGYERKDAIECANNYALCRCGSSKTKPFCDGSHARIGFDGTETANKEIYAKRCDTVSGPEIDLDDLPELCARARFCHDQKGDVWSNTQNSNDRNLKKEAVRQACLCPSGRLIVRNKNGESIEPELKKEIGLIEDPRKHASGPVWVKGGIEIEGADGKRYETRNRVTLCRCGKSTNKPFCDGCHIDEKFNDGDPSLK